MTTRMTIAGWALSALCAAMVASGCGATPIGAAVNLAGTAINDGDVHQKTAELMGVSVAQCDQKLGQPVNVFESQNPPRQWRVYSVKDDVAGLFRYVIEFNDGRVIAVNKAQQASDIVVDTATYTYFREKCIGQTSEACQMNTGHGPPVLSVRNVRTGQLIQLYDARLVKDVQRPYYAVLFFGNDGNCADIKVIKIAASSTDNPTGQ